MRGNTIFHGTATCPIETDMTAPPKTLRVQSHLPVMPLNKGTGFRALGIRGDSAVMDPYLMVDLLDEPTHVWPASARRFFGRHLHV
jgi:hypothetical protein